MAQHNDWEKVPVGTGARGPGVKMYIVQWFLYNHITDPSPLKRKEPVWEQEKDIQILSLYLMEGVMYFSSRGLQLYSISSGETDIQAGFKWTFRISFCVWQCLALPGVAVSPHWQLFLIVALGCFSLCWCDTESVRQILWLWCCVLLQELFTSLTYCYKC